MERLEAPPEAQRANPLVPPEPEANLEAAAETTEPAQPIAATLAAPLGERLATGEIATGTDAAFDSLFRLWDLDYAPDAGLACEQAEAQGLKCLFQRGTWGAQFHPQLGPQAGEVVAGAHWFQNAFMNTDLGLQLQVRDIGDDGDRLRRPQVPAPEVAAVVDEHEPPQRVLAPPDLVDRDDALLLAPRHLA